MPLPAAAVKSAARLHWLLCAYAVFLFVLRMSRSNIRRLYRADTVRSRKARGSREMTILEAKGSSILILELQGALFFGSADRLARMIDAEAADGTQSSGEVILIGRFRLLRRSLCE